MASSEAVIVALVDTRRSYCNILDPFEPFQTNVGPIGTFGPF